MARAYAEKIRSDGQRLEQESRPIRKTPVCWAGLPYTIPWKGTTKRPLRSSTSCFLQPDNLMYYNIACISAKQGKTDDALKCWPMDRGFRNRELMQDDRDLTASETPAVSEPLESM